LLELGVLFHRKHDWFAFVVIRANEAGAEEWMSALLLN